MGKALLATFLEHLGIFEGFLNFAELVPKTQESAHPLLQMIIL